MGEAEAAVANFDPKKVVTETADDVVRFVEVLAEWLVPIIGIILGLFVGPAIFAGTSIGAALWTQGLQSKNPTTQGSNAWLIGTLTGAAVVGVAAGSLWSHSNSRAGVMRFVSRALAGFTIGWALGILIGGLNAYFVTGTTGPGNPFQNSWLDNAIMNAANLAQATVAKV